MILAISTMKTVKRSRSRRRMRKKTCIPQKVHPCMCLLIVASSFKTKRTSSAETIREYSDSDSDQALDLAALKRARRENPGTISILGSLSGTDGKLEDDEAKANAEKAKQLFDLPSTEKIITGNF